MTYDGGYVRAAMPFPGRPGITAVLGTWSGGGWRGLPIEVAQYRGASVAGVWRVVGVDASARVKRSPVLLMEPVLDSGQSFAPGDVITFGEPYGDFTFFDVAETTLPIKEDATILFGSSKLHGVACVEDGRVTRLLLFHSAIEILPLSETHAIWWNESQYSVTVQQEPTGEVEFYIDDDAVSLSRVIYTLVPVHRFTLNSGHEMMSGTPRTKRGPVSGHVKRMFEPTLSVLPGSVRLIVHQPTTLGNLFVKPHEPLSLLAAALIDVSRKDQAALLTALGERVFAVKNYLGILNDLYRSVGDESLKVRVNGRPVLRIAAGESRQWLNGLMRLPDRVCTRTGFLYAADSHRNWCKVLLDDGEQKEDWTFRHKPSQTDAVAQFFRKRVLVKFSTRVPEAARGGAGTLLKIDQSDSI